MSKSSTSGSKHSSADTQSSHEKRPEKSHKEHKEHVKQEKHEKHHSSSKHKNDPGSSHDKHKNDPGSSYDNAASASAGLSTAMQRQNVFDALSSETFTKPVKEEKPEPAPSSKVPSSNVSSNVSSQHSTPTSHKPSLPSTPTIQKTSLAEYKERREREKALNKSVSALDSGLKVHVKTEPGLSNDAEKIKKSHSVSDLEHMKKSHGHSSHPGFHHLKHGSEGRSTPEAKLRIKTEPSSSNSPMPRQPDTKFKLSSNINPDLLKMPETKLNLKELHMKDHSPAVPSHSASRVDGSGRSDGRVDVSGRAEVGSGESKHRKDASLLTSIPAVPELKLHVKSEPNSPQVPSKPEVKLKIKPPPPSDPSVSQAGASPLKLKIKMPKEPQYSDKNGHREQKVQPLKLSAHPSRVKSSEDSPSSSKHSHKSHKSKHSHSSSHKGTNGKSDLKLHIKMSDIQKQGAGVVEGEKKVSDKHQRNLEKSRSEKPSPQKDLLSRSKSDASSLSRKRPLMSPSDPMSSESHKSKMAKSSDGQMRRSISGHSANMSGSQSVASNSLDNHVSRRVVDTSVNQQLQILQNAAKVIERNIVESQSGKSSPVVPPAGFNMSQPFIPQFAQLCQPQPPPPLPPEPPSHPPPPVPQPPPPPPPTIFTHSDFSRTHSQHSTYGFEPVVSLSDLDFLDDDDNMPPLPDEQPPIRPPSPSIPPPPPRY